MTIFATNFNFIIKKAPDNFILLLNFVILIEHYDYYCYFMFLSLNLVLIIIYFIIYHDD